MLRGWMVEMEPVEKVLGSPLHPYTQNLKESIPQADPDKVRDKKTNLAVLDSDEYLRRGCRFAGRCPYVMDVCRNQVPANYQADERMVECFLYDEQTVGTEGVARHVGGEIPSSISVI